MIPGYYDDFDQWMLPNRVLIIYGPRRFGKSPLKYRFDSCDNIRVRGGKIYSGQSFQLLRLC